MTIFRLRPDRIGLLFALALGVRPRPWWKRLLRIDRPYTHSYTQARLCDGKYGCPGGCGNPIHDAKLTR